MDVLRQGIGLRGYGQRNPIQEYALEGFNLFEEMKADIRFNVAKLLFRVQVETDQRLEHRQQRPSSVEYSTDRPQPGVGQGGEGGPTRPIHVDKKVGRNDPCPCGSGKKYKHCHGRAAA
ncbi:MAG: SEC-C metal-binding domain-containing protein [Deinococcales bacterium]